MAWEPLVRRDTDPNWVQNPGIEDSGLDPPDEVWVNEAYQVVVRYQPGNEGVMWHLSIHTNTRYPIHDWRHLQQIKNEVCGEERWAIEVYPPESDLVDTANEFHLWVMPEGVPLGIGFTGQRFVSSDEQTERFNRLREEGKHKGRQREWEPGLTTGSGRNEHSDPMMDNHLDALEKGNS